LPGRRGNEIDNYQNIRTKKRARADDEWNDINGETCLVGLSNQHQADVSNMLYNDVACASISNNNTSPTLISR